MTMFSELKRPTSPCATGFAAELPHREASFRSGSRSQQFIHLHLCHLCHLVGHCSSTCSFIHCRPRSYDYKYPQVSLLPCHHCPLPDTEHLPSYQSLSKLLRSTTNSSSLLRPSCLPLGAPLSPAHPLVAAVDQRRFRAHAHPHHRQTQHWGRCRIWLSQSTHLALQALVREARCSTF